MKLKLKKLLEGFAWERTPGKALPTMADVRRKHQRNLREDDAFAPGDVFGGGGEGNGAAADVQGNVVQKKFDLLLKDKQQFQNIAAIYQKVSVIKQVEFLQYLLDTLGTPKDAKKKLKMRL
jgi:hypothetical protein